jgi:hypothetical protein
MKIELIGFDKMSDKTRAKLKGRISDASGSDDVSFADEPIPGNTAKGRRACERAGGHEWHSLYTDAGCGRCGASDKYR